MRSRKNNMKYKLRRTNTRQEDCYYGDFMVRAFVHLKYAYMFKTTAQLSVW